MKTLIYYTLVIVSQIFFLRAFFPIAEIGETTKIERPKSLHDIKFNETFHHTALADKLIFVVIDALRLDFFTPQHMPFLHKTADCSLTIHVQSPTVTLPRIKSLTTGRVPQFIDILLNLGTTGAIKDSFLHQAVKKGKKIVFYGDNTWLKIYPEIFVRSEGVSSFFVNDFTEVDNNVTRNLNEELEKTDWDIMFLHYLGLDHIGHVFGPHSKLVPEKLAEMDGVIQILYDKSQEWDKKTVIFVTGDHGMKDSGGHGGSTFAETHVPLVVLNQKCLNGSAEQVDVAPSLSVLMGVDISSGSVGKVINNFMLSLDFELQNYLLLYNSLVLNNNSSIGFGEILDRAKEFHYDFLKTGNSSEALKASQLYEDYLSKTSELLIKTSVEQNMNGLLLSLLFTIFCFLQILNFSFQKGSAEIDLLLVLCLLRFATFFFSLYIILVIVLIADLTFRVSGLIYKKLCCDVNFIYASLTVIHVFALISSSFIEEEHQIWYFFLSTFIIFKIFTATNLYDFFQFGLVAAVFRFVRTLNQTGDKWALLPDTADWFLKDENYFCLQNFFLLNLFLVWICSYYFNSNSPIINTLNAVVLCLVYIFNSVFPDSIFLGRLIWTTIFLNTIICVLTKNSFINIWLLIATLLLRDYNVILLPTCVLLSKLICGTDLTVFAKATLHYWLGNALYFCQGHSNSFASVDVSVGYIGLENYVPSIVISQVLCHTYALPVLSHLLLLKNCKKDARHCWNVLLIWKMFCLIFVDIVTVLHRHHLFIWSVFAPKLLIESCHATVLLLELTAWFITIKLFKK